MHCECIADCMFQSKVHQMLYWEIYIETFALENPFPSSIARFAVLFRRYSLLSRDFLVKLPENSFGITF